MKATILIAEDEPSIRKSLAERLAENGYLVRAAANGDAAVKMVREERPDLVLMDVMMPVLDGYEACAAIREFDRELPIVFLSALDRDEDQIRGLEAGGDDYVSKTASDEMLLARIRAALARAKRFAKEEAPQLMTKIEADIYRLLKSERGRLFSYREIFAAILGEGYYADEGAIRTHISHLRKKLPRDEQIVAKRRQGYCLI